MFDSAIEIGGTRQHDAIVPIEPAISFQIKIVLPPTGPVSRLGLELVRLARHELGAAHGVPKAGH
jgi:hypothetical protein